MVLSENTNKETKLNNEDKIALLAEQANETAGIKEGPDNTLFVQVKQAEKADQKILSENADDSGE